MGVAPPNPRRLYFFPSCIQVDGKGIGNILPRGVSYERDMKKLEIKLSEQSVMAIG
jgi:hypothetical protein